MRTFIDVLRDNTVHADRAVTFVRTNGQERRVAYPELWAEASRRARALQALGLSKGDRVALILPEPDEFVLSFVGALTAGLVAVPMYPPATLAKLEAYGDTVRHVLAASGARVVVTNDALRPLIQEHLLGSQSAETRLVLERDLGTIDPGSAHTTLPDVRGEDLAFLQFTSGSTSRPKGVMVTHENLSVNSHAIMFDGLRSTPEDRGVSWLPLYHDMGLIGFVIAPVYALVQVMFLPTMSFIRRPSLWLESIHRFRGTITFAPNFAFALATRAVTENQAGGWDLSCMRALGCGAEPIQADVLRAFLARFEKYGLSPESILPCYGMAEATLAVTFHDLGKPLTTDRIDLATMKAGTAEPAKDEAPALELVSCGRPFPGHDLAIVGPDGAPLGERQVGEIWLRGPSVTAGYFGDDEATTETFGGGYLRTGDLGYRADGNVYICGRSKDLIILNGKNHYPQDIERVASTVDGIRDGQCVAFARRGASGAEEAVLVAESRRLGEAKRALIEAVTHAVRAELGVQLAEVVLIKRGTLPKTSSGKVRRRETKMRLENGQLELVGEPGEDPNASFDSPAVPSPRTPARETETRGAL
ncbi:fatty acyl-AMP ligase [Polyangium sp. y55x31]|uniref:fatty acyl-AMP ligase n=1 Tax=Polyangium sp. y55x31 TaxID=3042688 RepID=UPI002482D4A9|nr:fatty acyl-AMP ligase [Polyangium sp. y55x31]MDI1482403.1 fatty acyl-AMP ligase [Polyangium sp. y55x31]